MDDVRSDRGIHTLLRVWTGGAMPRLARTRHTWSDQKVFQVHVVQWCKGGSTAQYRYSTSELAGRTDCGEAAGQELPPHLISSSNVWGDFGARETPFRGVKGRV